MQMGEAWVDPFYERATQAGCVRLDGRPNRKRHIVIALTKLVLLTFF
jgi:hypothetical protein